MNSQHEQREADQHSACENSAADPADSPPPCTGVRAEDMDTRTLGDHAFSDCALRAQPCLRRTAIWIGNLDAARSQRIQYSVGLKTPEDDSPSICQN